MNNPFPLSIVQELDKNVHNTVGKAIQILETLEKSLKEAGYDLNLETYQKMADILVEQYHWHENHGNKDLKEFSELTLHAHRIYELLHPYSDIMYRLSRIGEASTEIKTKGISITVLPPELVMVLNLLSSCKSPMSFTALRSALAIDRKDLKNRLENLEREGLVILKDVGGREMVYLLE